MNTTKKCAFIVIFFGKFPDYFPFWAQSCIANHEHIHWYVYTDATDYSYQLNKAVSVFPFTFKRLTDNFKKNLGIHITTNCIRKVCDFRPLYYFLIDNRDDFDKFDFIGYTDIDMIYGKINMFLPDKMSEYAIVSGNTNHLCGPFTLINKNFLNVIKDYDNIKKIMEDEKHLAFDESIELLNLIQRNGGNILCSAEQLQPQRSKRFNHRKTFCIWKQDGSVTVFDNRFHKKEGAFYHFSRYKDKKRFKINNVDLNKENFGVYKYGVVTVRSQTTVLSMRLSLLY